MKSVLVLMLLSVFVFESGFGQQNSPSGLLDRILRQGYDARDRPGPQNRPTTVTANIYLRYMRPSANGFDVDLTFRLAWNDPRLRFPQEPGPQHAFISTTTKDHKIWTPDTFFQNALNVQQHATPNLNELIRVYPDGNILLSQRLFMTIICPAQSKNVVCELSFASYSFTSNDIVYEWKNDTPVQQKDGLGRALENFGIELTAVKTDSCASATNTGTYSCLRVKLFLERYLSGGSTAKLYFVPILLVILSWLPFILNTPLIIVRVLIGLFCLSTFVLHWSIIANTHAANFSVGAAATDVFLTRCLGLIALTFVQLIVFVWITRSTTAHKERKLAKAKAKIKHGAVDELVLVTDAEPEPEPVPRRKLSTMLIIDLISLGIFVLAFFIFIIHFVSTY